MLQRRAISLLTITPLLFACATTPAPPAEQCVAELAAHQAPDARFGERMDLLNESPVRVVGIISNDRRAHVWAIDSSKTLHHVEVDVNGAVSRERVGTVEDDPRTMAFDAVESRPGTLRVLAGASQFVRGTTNSEWQEVKGNRCIRFLAIAEALYCGLVVSGEELGAPKRMDWYAGVFVIVPYAIPVQRQSRKLVIAEALGDAWIMRTVLDVDDALDAEPNFLMGADSGGNVHVVYAVGRGGTFLLIGPGVAGWEAQSTVRYARVDSESLLQRVAVAEGEPVKPLVSVSGREIKAPPWQIYHGGSLTSAFAAGAGFAFDPTTGLLRGLVNGLGDRRAMRPRGGETACKGVIDVALRAGVWQERVEWVLLNDWPTEGMDYHFPRAYRSIAFDSRGGMHALVPLCTNHPIWVPCKGAVSYLVKRGGRWSKPITVSAPFDLRQHGWGQRLLIAGEPLAFAAWAEGGAGLVGRWILPLAAEVR